MDNHTKLLVGTSKGLVIYKRTANGWETEQVEFVGFPVSVVYVNEIDNSWWVCLAHRHWGQKIHRSADQGKTWEQISTPEYPEGTVKPNGQPATLKKVWCISHAGQDRPGELYLGTEPGGLFHTEDNGQNFHLNRSLWDHPSRKKDWFGAGRDFPFIHSIVIDPRDNDHLYIAVSCAGVFETRDGGKTWVPKNNGLLAAYLPNPEAEVGHDPHRLFACRANPDIMWQQNHCGIFRTTNGGEQWDNITGKDGFPDYGFALAIDHKNPGRAWVIPAVSDEIRVAVDLALCVCRTDDGGKTWQELRNGLPQENCFDIVFRHSFAIKDNILAFGSTSGNLYLSEDYGDSWNCLTNNLQRIEYVTFA